MSAALDQKHPCHAKVDANFEGSFPIIWVRGDELPLASGARKIKKTWVGVCGFSHRIHRISSNTVEMIVISDVIVTHGKCEDARSCLAKECPLNKTPESIKKKLIGARKLPDLSVLTGHQLCQLFKDNPQAGGFVVPKS